MDKDKFDCELMSWEYFYELSKIASKKIIQSNSIPDVIIGLARGGWFFSRILCDFLGVKDLLSLKVEHWGITATPDGKARLKYPLSVNLTKEKTLIVDDITDTGESMIKAVEHVKTLKPSEVYTAAIMHIKGSKFVPDYFAKEISWRWVIFPWNLTEDLCNLIPKALHYSDSEPDIATTKENLMKKFKINVDEKTIEEVLKECKRRSIIK